MCTHIFIYIYMCTIYLYLYLSIYIYTCYMSHFELSGEVTVPRFFRPWWISSTASAAACSSRSRRWQRGSPEHPGWGIPRFKNPQYVRRRENDEKIMEHVLRTQHFIQGLITFTRGLLLLNYKQNNRNLYNRDYYGYNDIYSIHNSYWPITNQDLID